MEQMVPMSELMEIERGVIDKPLFTKDLKGVSYVFGDMAGQLDSPLYGLFAIRDKLAKAALPGTGEMGEYWITQPAETYRQYAIKWDGELQITYDTFRDMGAAYAVGLVLIYLLVVAQFRSYLNTLGHHGTHPANYYWCYAGPCYVGFAVHCYVHDWHDRIGRHHCAQLNIVG